MQPNTQETHYTTCNPAHSNTLHNMQPNTQRHITRPLVCLHHSPNRIYTVRHKPNLDHLDIRRPNQKLTKSSFRPSDRAGQGGERRKTEYIALVTNTRRQPPVRELLTTNMAQVEIIQIMDSYIWHRTVWSILIDDGCKCWLPSTLNTFTSNASWPCL
jgi:hypothetical protein